MNFLFETYSGVAWWQLAGGWILAGAMFTVTCTAIAKTLSLRRRLKHIEWVKASQWSAEDYGRIIQKQRGDIIDLKAKIDRLISRPRQANGRFAKGSK